MLKQSLLIELPCTNLPFLTVAVRYVISGMVRVLVLLWRGYLPWHDGGSLGWLVLAFRWHWWWLGTITNCPQADHGIQVAEPAKYSNYIICACTVANAGNLIFWLRFWCFVHRASQYNLSQWSTWWPNF